MATPSPTIPTFTDGLVVHATDLNALASNLTNLYNYNQASFNSQRPCVIVKQTTGQSIANNTNVLINFQSALVNTDNMWTASVANQITIQHAGIYLIIGQTCYPQAGAPTVTTTNAANILVNSTNPSTNAVSSSGGGGGINASGPCTATLQNLAAGATVFLNTAHTYGGTINLLTTFGSSWFSAIYITSST